MSLRLLKVTGHIPIFAVVFALVNLHSVDHYVRGQLDAFVLLGIALGWWGIQRRQPHSLSLGLCLMLMKPPLNVALPILYYFLAVRHWEWREKLWVIFWPILMVIVATVLVGLKWPILFVNTMLTTQGNLVTYLSISLWNGARQLGLPTWPVAIAAVIVIGAVFRVALREEISHRVLSMMLAANLLFTTYANGEHYVVLIPAFLAVLTTFMPLSRLVLGYNAATLDIVYPLVLLVGAWRLRDSPRTASSEALAPSTAAESS
jgi:glycosyl transferase family 87